MLLVAPIVVPLSTAILTLLVRGRGPDWIISLVGAVALFFSGVALLSAVAENGPMAAQMGAWAAPFGITLFVDLLSAAMVTIAGLVAICVVVFSLRDVNEDERRVGFHPLSHALLGGVCGAFMTGDIFNLYVWFEVMLISSFGLLVIGGRKDQIDAAVKYVGLNLIATLAFLSGVGILYGVAGTLNMADLHLALEGRQNERAVVASAAFLIFAFGAKAALFPLFSWLPASYHTPAFATSALFAALLTKVGVYALLRSFTIVYDGSEGWIQGVLMVAAILTMIVGISGAVSQTQIRRILGFTIISAIGYMVLGLAIYTPLAIMGALFYLFHDIIVKANLYFLSGVIARKAGSEDIEEIGGLLKASPVLAVLFLVPALALAGVPPLSGFWAKVLVVRATLDAEQWFATFAVLAAGFVTLYAMGRVWMEVFWKDHPDSDADLSAKVPGSMILPVVVLGLVTVVMGVFASPFVELSRDAAEFLLDPKAYVSVVLGPEAVR